MSEFFVGQKVVCVDDDFSMYENFAWERFPLRNSIYTIREIIPDARRPGLRLHEIVNAPSQYFYGFGELYWGFARFRPLESKAISIFRKIAQDVTDGKVVEFVE